MQGNIEALITQKDGLKSGEITNKTKRRIINLKKHLQPKLQKWS